MNIVSVALAANYSAVLSLLGLDTSQPIGLSLSVGQTVNDSFNLYGTNDAAAVNNNNAFLISTFTGALQNFPDKIVKEASAWPFLLIQRTGGSTAGTFIVAGNPAASPAPVAVAAPVVVGNYSGLMTLTALGALDIRISGSTAMVAGDSFDVFCSNDATLASSVGAYYAGRIYGGGGANINQNKVISGYNYAIIQRVTGSTAGTIIAAGISPSAGGGTLNLTTLAVGDTAVNGPIGALTAAQTVDIYSSFLLTQTTGGITAATLPNPTNTTAGKVALVMNNDTSAFQITMYGETINPGAMQVFEWDGTVWSGGQNITQNGNAFGTGMLITTLDVQSVTLRSNTTAFVTVDSGTTGAVNLGTGANAKVVTIGNATLTTSVVINVGTGAFLVGSNGTDHATTLGSVAGASLTTVQGGTSGVTIQPAPTGPVTITTGTTGTLTLDSGTTGAVNLGRGAFAKAITIGNVTLATSVTVSVGTGALLLGADATDHATTLGSVTGASLTTIQGGTGGVTVQPAATGPVSITTGTTGTLTLDSGTTGAVNIGTNANAKAITMGNATGGTTVQITAGTSVTLLGGNAVNITTSATSPINITAGTTGGIWSTGAQIDVPIATIADGTGSLGTAPNTVDTTSLLLVNQATPVVLYANMRTIAAPTNAAVGRRLTICNVGTAAFIVGDATQLQGVNLIPGTTPGGAASASKGQAASFTWNGTAWVPDDPGPGCPVVAAGLADADAPIPRAGRYTIYRMASLANNRVLTASMTGALIGDRIDIIRDDGTQANTLTINNAAAAALAVMPASKKATCTIMYLGTGDWQLAGGGAF